VETFRIIVKGRVQGVGYRYFCKKQAEKLEIKGWVRNEQGGSVSLEVQGEKKQEFLEKLKKGTPYAKVESVDVQKVEKPEFETFKVRY